MSNPIIFKDLPATFPEEDKYQKSSLASSVVFHFLLIFMLVVFPLMFPRTIEEWQLTTLLVSPPPPPPAGLPAVIEVVVEVKPSPARITPPVKIDSDALISPIAVPKDIARIVDEPIDFSAGVIGGVPGGMPGGVASGILGGILASNERAEMAAPPPPPPLPPAAVAPPPPVRPIRIGGNVQEPRVIKLVSPAYPPLARKARVTGMVVLEATLTAEGTVEEIRVVSGHPLLINAAIECVKHWIYEPTYLNGTPVPVILTAKVNFQHKDAL